MRIPPKCVQSTKARIHELSEQQVVLTLVNSDLLNLEIVHVDGCVFANQPTKRCDYLVNVQAVGRSHFVELKGSDIDGVIEQLAHSTVLLKDNTQRKVYWVICFSGNPRFSTGIQNLKTVAFLRHRAWLHVVNSGEEYKV